MREAVFVSYARTGLAKAGRGGFNITPAMTMAAHAISSAVDKAGIEPEVVEDVALGNGAHGAANLGRLAGLLAGLPVTTGGNTIQRHCSSGLNSIAVAANYIKADGADCVVAGGVVLHDALRSRSARDVCTYALPIVLMLLPHLLWRRLYYGS